MAGSRHGLALVAPRQLVDAAFQGGAVGDDAALGRGRGGDLAAAGARHPVRVRRLVVDRGDRALDDDLAPHGVPREQQRRPRVGCQLPALAAVAVGEEDEALGPEPPQQHRPTAGRPWSVAELTTMASGSPTATPRQAANQPANWSMGSAATSPSDRPASAYSWRS